MSQQRSSREEAIYDRVMYPGPEPRVPVNKLGIREWAALERKETEIVERRIKSGLPPEALELSYAGLKAMHRHMFQDIYQWAGEERTYTTGRNEAVPFAPPEHITSWMGKQFAQLAKDNYLRGLDAVAFAEKASAFVNEINAAHPFIEGNGRVQRLFLQRLAE